MKVGDMVQPRKGAIFVNDAIGIVLDSRTLVSRSGLSTNQVKIMGKDVNSHQIYWGHPKKKVCWMMERDLVRVV